MKKRIFLFMGPPGSGKGTLSSFCVKLFGWNQMSTGALCRDHLNRKTDLGLMMKAAIDSGKLVSDEIISDIVNDWILSKETTLQNIIFDGYPRTKKQAELFYDFMNENLSHCELILVKLNVPTGLLVDRILSRVTCSNKDCQQVYSLNIGSGAQPKEDMICDVCKSELVSRSDDTREALETRIEIYKKNEQQIVDFYRDQSVESVELDGLKPIREVFDTFYQIAKKNSYVC